jgi:hypothetical protein
MAFMLMNSGTSVLRTFANRCRPTGWRWCMSSDAGLK